MIEFTLKRTSSASIEAVFDALTNHRGIADSVRGVRRSSLDKEGTPPPNGVGAVRRLEAIGPPVVEEIIDYQRPARFTYRLLSGAPVRDHVGTVDLREVDTGTEVTWHLRSTPKIPGSSPLLKRVLKAVIGQALKGGIAAAERSDKRAEQDADS